MSPVLTALIESIQRWSAVRPTREGYGPDRPSLRLAYEDGLWFASWFMFHEHDEDLDEAMRKLTVSVELDSSV